MNNKSNYISSTKMTYRYAYLYIILDYDNTLLYNYLNIKYVYRILYDII